MTKDHAPRCPAFMIVGSSRSGTTFVQRLAMELDGVGFPPETHYFTEAVPLVDDRDFPLGPELIRTFIERYTSLDVMRAVELTAEPVVARLPGGVALDHVALFCAIVDVLTPAEATLVGEKTPLHIHTVERLSVLMPHLKVIGVVRDPRGRALSVSRTPWGTQDPYQAAQRWNRDQTSLLDAARRLGPAERMVVLRFEDAIDDPRAAQAQIAQLLGIEAAPVRPVLAHELALPWETWKQRAAEPPDPTRVDAWRTELPAKDAEIIATLTARNLKRLGYQVGPRSFAARSAAYRFIVRSRWVQARRGVAHRAKRALTKSHTMSLL